ncbi:uncharacterized protein G2W53_032057 [Senna tora]|uniref:Uncharacterized protein n=1 Tax=Senna tora TaxID=362788 RepID=A0A834SY95_9FABA|nr:uncharacterized protein G2W53_032057 [Senna tora]
MPKAQDSKTQLDKGKKVIGITTGQMACETEIRGVRKSMRMMRPTWKMAGIRCNGSVEGHKIMLPPSSTIPIRKNYSSSYNSPSSCIVAAIVYDSKPKLVFCILQDEVRYTMVFDLENVNDETTWVLIMLEEAWFEWGIVHMGTNNGFTYRFDNKSTVLGIDLEQE